MVIYYEPIHFVAQQYFVLLLLCSVSNTVLVAAILKVNILVRECNKNILDKVFCSLIFDKLYLTLLSNVHLFWITLSISEASVDWGKYRKKITKVSGNLNKDLFQSQDLSSTLENRFVSSCKHFISTLEDGIFRQREIRGAAFGRRKRFELWILTERPHK